jgi:hypothetical protein
MEEQGQQVDAQKVINSLLRQITEAAQKIALLEALLEQAEIESVAQRVANQQSLNNGPTGS